MIEPHAVEAQRLERVIAAGGGRLGRVAAVPAVLAQQIADLGDLPLAGLLHRDPALPDERAGLLAQHRPEAEAVPRIAVKLAAQPVVHLRVVKRMGVGVHHLRVLQHRAERGPVVRRQPAQTQPFRFQNHTDIPPSQRTAREKTRTVPSPGRRAPRGFGAPAGTVFFSRRFCPRGFSAF